MNYKLFSFAELKRMRISKEQLAEQMGLIKSGAEFDYAIPTSWLDIQVARMNPSVDNARDLIQSTTFWVYDIDEAFGRPLSGCTEVALCIRTQEEMLMKSIDTLTVA
jgi:hypothetical protein